MLNGQGALAMTGKIEFKNGLPFAAEGFGVRRNFYASGRITAKVSDIAGVFELDYVGRQHFKNQRFYSAGEQCTFQRCMVVQALVDGRPYRLAFENTTHYPFGYASECTLEGVKLRHELVLDRNALFRRVTVLDNPEGKEVRCRLVQMNAGMGQGAKWSKAVRPDGSLRLVAEARFEGGASVAMEIGAAGPVAFPDNSSVDPRAFPRSPDHTQEFRFDMEERGNRPVHLFWWVFDPAPDEELSSARVDRVFEDFRARRAADARFETGDAFADGHLGFVPAVAAAMEVDGAGAFRASPTYWVWGWDALVHSGPLAFTGRAAEVRRMLAFFRDTAGDGGRICHAYATDFGKHDADVSDPGEVNFDAVNSSFWLILLADYVAATGDGSFKAECMRFARSLVEKNAAAIRAASASAGGAPSLLPRGQGWIPDNRYPLGQEKDDLCLSNCSVYWQGLCAWRELSGEDPGVEAAAREIAEKFWDPAAGYWCDSWDSAAGRPRPFRPLHGFYHVSRFAREFFRTAAAPRSFAAMAGFMERHFLLGERLAMYDVLSPVRRADGNQFGAYYPVQDRTFWSVQNLAGRTGALSLFRKIVGAHGAVLTYPEGQTVDVVNADPAECSDELGNKQFFAAKGWFADALELWLGLSVAKDGVSFHPMNDGIPFAVRGLSLRGATLDVEMHGAGAADSARLALDGAPLSEPFVPWSALAPGRRSTLRIDFAP